MNKAKTIFIIFLSFILLCTVLLCSVIDCKNNLIFSQYNVKTDEIKSSVKIAFIADLHDSEFGKNNCNLVNAIADKNPDLIAVGGDMLNNSSTEHSIVVSLLKKLTKIAPTYYILGNHERHYVNLEELIKDIKSTGTIFLDNEMVKFSNKNMNGESITIGGITDYPYYDYDYPDFENDERYFIDAFLEHSKSNYGILLAHQPELYIWKFKDYNLDLILSGHTHGGLVKLPFIDGLFAPTQNFFPHYDNGYFTENTAPIIITSGLGTSCKIPRINNNPEICIININ